MREFTNSGRRTNVVGVEALIGWINGEKPPNVAATLTLKEKTWKFSGYKVDGDRYEYEKDYLAFIHRLSETFYGKAYWRHGKMVSNVATLEGDGETKRYHVHAALRCPDHVALDTFMAKAEEIWLGRSPWAMSDAKIEPITGRWAAYTLKEGSEALLVSALRL